MDPPTEIDLENATPSQLLLLAATLGRTDLVMSAINSGADVNAQIAKPSDPNVTLTALHAAVQNRHVDVTRALLSVPVDLHLTDSAGRTALSYLPSKPHALELHGVFASDLCQKAARNDYVAVDHAIDAGLDPTAVDSPELGNTPLHWAASFGATDCVRVLLSAAVPLDPLNKSGNTPLHDAALAGHANVVRQLVEAGADTSVTDSDGRPMHDLDLSDSVRSALHRDDGVTETQVRPPLESHDDLSTQPSIPPTPSFLPGDSRPAAPPPDLPDWASALWPLPQRFCECGSFFTVPPVLTISAENSCLPVARLLAQWVSECRPLHEVDTIVRLVGGGFGGVGSPIAFSAAIFLRIDSNVLEHANQAYSICIRDFGIDIVASDLPGLFYACSTLVNLFNLSMGRIDDPGAPLAIPTLSISDWPSIQRRGLYLNISRKRIPTIETLKELVSFMSRHLKLNQLHLNISSNFDRLKGLSREAMFRHEDILELNRWCNDHYVDLIPVIVQPLPTIKTLPDTGVESTVPNGSTHEMLKVFPTADSDDEMLFDEYLPLFDSDQISLRISNQQIASKVPDFAQVRALLHTLRPRGKRTLQMFGNNIADVLADEKLAPSTLPELPAQMVLILEVDEQREGLLDKNCLRMRKIGIPFYTCASSCLEQSFSGRLSACLTQIESAADSAKQQGATGIMLKDSSLSEGDAPLVFLFQSLLPFGGAAWNTDRVIRGGLSDPEGALPHLLDTYIFHDRAEKGVLGSIAVVLGDLHVSAGDTDGKVLPRLLAQREDGLADLLHNLTYLGLRRAVKRADRIEVALSGYKGNAGATDVSELRMAAIFMGVAARMGAWLLSISSAVSMEPNGRPNHSTHEDGRSVALTSLPDGRRSDLCNNLLQAIELMREAWMRRYHKFGFVEAVDSIVGKALTNLAHGMPYEGYLEERRSAEWVPDY